MSSYSHYRPYLLWGLAIVGALVVAGTLAYSLFFDGEVRDIQDTGVFPAGEDRAPGALPRNLGDGGDNAPPNSTEQRLFQIHDRPVVSSVLFIRSGDVYARFIEEGSGHVYEYDLRNRRGYRISNTSIPQITEALWSQDATVVAFRYEDGGILKAAVGELSTTTEERAFLKVHFLPEGIRSLALSPDGRSVFYITRDQTLGGAAGIIANRDGSSPRLIFSSKLSAWSTSWPAANTVLVSSPWSSDGGLVYRINPQNGSRSIVFSTTGLFIGAVGGPKGELLVADPDTNRLASVDQSGALLPELTLSWPSLCSFSVGPTSTAACADIPERGYSLFEEWSRGEYDFVSNLAIIDFVSGLTVFALSSDDLRDRSFDIINPSLSPDASYVLFKNKIDGLLWGVTLNNRL